VLIESRRPRRTPLPVLTRGRPDHATGRDEGVVAQPSLLPPYPTLEAVRPPSEQVAARMGETVTLEGHHLDGATVRVRFTGPRGRPSVELAPLAGATAARVRVEIPPDPPSPPVPATSPLHPDNWPAGVYGVAVVVRRPGEPDRSSNELPLILAPRFAAITPTLGADGVTFPVACSPPVHATQTAALVVCDRELPARPLASPVSGSLTFVGTGFASGTPEWVRLRVDGIDSLLIDRAARPPRFDPTQRVTIP
jgi:hypothetical protein